MVSAKVLKEQVALARRYGLSKRSACRWLSISRANLYRKPKMPARDAPVIAAMRAISNENPRWGYRRAWAVLPKQNIHISCNRAHRVWKKAGLQVPLRKRRRRGPKRPNPNNKATRPNEVWACDFIFDACSNGQKLKCLTLVDEFTRECLAIDVQGQLRSHRVIEVLDAVATLRGFPEALRSDNGPEFIARRLKNWLREKGVVTAYTQPGCPWQNGHIESFNGRFRDECLNQEWFHNRAEARVVIEGFRRSYNEERPHRSLNLQTPAAFSQELQQSSNGQGLTL